MAVVITYNNKVINFDNVPYVQSGISFDGLILYLDANNTLSYPSSGNIWNDLSPANNDGILVTPTYNTSGGGSFYFLPSSDFVNCGYGISALNLQQLTISFWLKPGTVTNTNENYLFHLDTVEGSPVYYGVGIGLYNFSSNAYGISSSVGDGIFYYSGNRKSTETTDRVIIKDVWQMVTFAYSSAQSVKVYRNGVELTNLSTSGSYNGSTIGSSYGAGRTLINNNNITSPHGVNGFMNDVVVYSRALTQAEVVNMYNIQSIKYL